MSAYCANCLQIKDPSEMCQSSYKGKTTWECLKRCKSATSDAFPRTRQVEYVATGVSIDDLVRDTAQFRDGRIRYTHPETGERYYKSAMSYGGDTLYQMSCITDDPRIPMLSLVFGVTFDDLKLADTQKPDSYLRYVIKKTGEHIKCSKDNEWSVDTV